MSGVRLLRAQDRVARPWKNGGGVTRDIAVFPEGADDRSFLWRASVATIAAAGPFSPFPGIDRALMPLDGELVVKIGGDARRLRPGSAALLFAGEDRVSAAPLGVACTVLNIMTRRGILSAKLGRCEVVQPTVADSLLLLATADAQVAVDGRRFDLSANDALLVDMPEGRSLSLGAPFIAAEICRQFVQ